MRKFIIALTLLITYSMSYATNSNKKNDTFNYTDIELVNVEIPQNSDFQFIETYSCFSTAVSVYRAALRAGFSGEDAYILADAFETVCNVLLTISSAMDN